MSTPFLTPASILESSEKMDTEVMLEKSIYNQKLEAANTLASICSAKSDKYSTSSQQKPSLFPKRLMAIVSDPLHSDLICWLPQGHAFVIRDINRFSAYILEEHMIPETTNISRFLKKLHRCGFKLISKASKDLVYFHPFFQRNDPEMCSYINCKHISSTIIGQSITDNSDKRMTNLESNWVSADESSLSDCDSSYQSNKRNTACDGSLIGNEHCYVEDTSISSLEMVETDQNDSNEQPDITSEQKDKFCEFSDFPTPSFSQHCIKNGQLHQSPPNTLNSEIERAFLSFREYHKTMISSAIEALLQSSSDIRAVQEYDR